MPDQVSFVTPNGLKRVQKELDHLRNVRRPQAIRQIKESLEQASAQASALENPDLDVARNEQAFIEGRILQLEVVLKTAVIIEPPQTNEVIGLGSKVTVTEGLDGVPENYCIVGSVEADPRNGYISNESPLGRALLGRGAGERVVIAAPDGDIEFCIQGVE